MLCDSDNAFIIDLLYLRFDLYLFFHFHHLSFELNLTESRILFPKHSIVLLCLMPLFLEIKFILIGCELENVHSFLYFLFSFIKYYRQLVLLGIQQMFLFLFYHSCLFLNLLRKLSNITICYEIFNSLFNHTQSFIFIGNEYFLTPCCQNS